MSRERLGSRYPQRPRGSQSGREKRRDESFQGRVEEPQGTDSHRTISKRSSECWLLFGPPKKALYDCTQSANRISRVLFVCSYTTAIVSPYLCVKGQLSSSIFYPERRELPMTRENVSDTISRIIPIWTEKILFLIDHKVCK